MNREELERPFDPALIKTRKGNNGKMLSFVPSAEYVKRLNQASADGSWDWEILEYKILDEEVFVLGKLTIDGTTKTEFGSSTITRATADNSIISIASDLKSASSDALKRCSMRFGLGLQFYTGTTAQSSQRPNHPNPSDHQPRLVPRPNKADITPKQLSYLFQCAKERGLSEQDVREMSLRDYGSEPERLSKMTGSKFIERILAMEDRGAA